MQCLSKSDGATLSRSRGGKEGEEREKERERERETEQELCVRVMVPPCPGPEVGYPPALSSWPPPGAG